MRAHLGMETQRQWNDTAIARTTPIVLGLFALVTVLAQTLCKQTTCLPRASAWYQKTKATFSDALAWVRHQLWQAFCRSVAETDMQKVTQPLLKRLIDTLCYAN